MKPGRVVAGIRVDPSPVFKRRRRIAGSGLAVFAVLAVAVATLARMGHDAAAPPAGRGGTATAVATATTTAPTPTSAAAAALVSPVVTAPPVVSVASRLVKLRVVGGDISPKSVVASGHGLVFAQNMMYRHSVTVYDAEGAQKATIPDSVDLRSFGFDQYPGSSYKGAPVEAAFTTDGRFGYVSNYSMYGPGVGPEGNDSCTKASHVDPSFVYRIDAQTLRIDQAIKVGAVPKYVAITPDQRHVLVSNWCTFDLSVIDVATHAEVQRIPLGPHPRGIVVSPDSRVAYVAVMGSRDIARVALDGFAVTWFRNVGSGPRHLVLSPDGHWLYVTTNGDGHVVKLDAATGVAVARAVTGQAPRSMAMAPDGQALYVVNYEASTLSKVRTDTMTVMQTLPTGHHPIGVTYEPTANRVWVACYSGSIMIFNDA
ncbi:MAG: family beta-propeller repeat protein [Acidimicrobiales bacterium]|nr:family beta-propeller repeat protein [Acidimicrobiales bacterium]